MNHYCKKYINTVIIIVYTPIRGIPGRIVSQNNENISIIKDGCVMVQIGGHSLSIPCEQLYQVSSSSSKLVSCIVFTQ
jgi:hypothetical protein